MEFDWNQNKLTFLCFFQEHKYNILILFDTFMFAKNVQIFFETQTMYFSVLGKNKDVFTLGKKTDELLITYFKIHRWRISSPVPCEIWNNIISVSFEKLITYELVNIVQKKIYEINFLWCDIFCNNRHFLLKIPFIYDYEFLNLTISVNKN